ncbi:Crp/Fnr family transcriptional regulator [Candidatus Saccharibacteria bacterium]|jgi:CRP-like cAMP-binding protein|nr:Crp/Fnr family transcriptional regulator [Candidatus Saccharibacteria bacterium]
MHSCLAKVPIFQHLSEEEMDYVHEFIHPKSFQKGEFIRRAGDTDSRLLVLNRGSANVLRASSGGNEIIIRNLLPGDYIGDSFVFGNQPADSDTVATTDSSFCVLSGQDLHALLRKYPELSFKIIADLSLKLKTSESQIESLSLKKADDRVLQALIDQSNGQTTFELKQTKKDIAGHIGMRPETFSRSLQKLQERGLIKIDGKTISLSADARKNLA